MPNQCGENCGLQLQILSLMLISPATAEVQTKVFTRDHCEAPEPANDTSLRPTVSGSLRLPSLFLDASGLPVSKSRRFSGQARRCSFCVDAYRYDRRALPKSISCNGMWRWGLQTVQETGVFARHAVQLQYVVITLLVQVVAELAQDVRALHALQA